MRDGTSRLAPILALCAAPAFANDCDWKPDGVAVIAATHHVDAQREFDEGLIPRGVGLVWECGKFDAGFAAFRNSFGNPGFGYAVTTDYVTLQMGDVSIKPTLGWNYYPEQETAALRKSGGLFPMAGLQVSYEMDAGDLWLRWYPSPIREGADSFDALLVAGATWRF